jgi:precorrin-2 dehydrogenase/sirohydrochlorin ferrochelatase
VSLSRYPAFINLNGKKCVVVGGGSVAERKVLALKDSGADITVVSPKLTRVLSMLKNKGAFFHFQRPYRKSDLQGAFLVVCATSDKKVNERVSVDASCLVNVVDQPELSNFASAAELKKGLLTITVSTSGACPSLAAAIRDDLSGLYGDSIKEFLKFMQGFRKRVFGTVKDPEARSEILTSAGAAAILELLKKDAVDEAISMVQNMYTQLAGDKKISVRRRKGA